MFNTNNLIPQTHVFLMSLVSDIAIFIFYTVVAILLGILIFKRKDIAFKGPLKVTLCLISLLSITKLMVLVNTWFPIHFIIAAVKVTTAIVALHFLYIIIKNINIFLKLIATNLNKKKPLEDIHSVMENFPVGILFSDCDGRITYTNKYVENLFQYTKEELHNKEVETLIQSSLRMKHLTERNNYFKNPTVKLMGAGRVLKGITKNGLLKFLEIGLQSSNHNEKTSAIVTIKDITQDEMNKRSLNETLELVRVATYGIPSLLSYIDKDGIYKYVNEAYTTKWRIQTERIIGLHYTNFLPKSTLEVIQEKMKRSLQGENLNFKTHVDFPEIGRRLLDIYYIPHISTEENEVKGVIVLAHDITELDSIVNELKISNQQLEDYAFLVSHDLRAPIRHIANFVELLEEEISNVQQSEKSEKYMKIIKSNSLKIQNMISGMLTIASISQIKPNIELLNLETELKQIAQVHSITLELYVKENCKELKIDSSILQSIFTNLFQNSENFVKEKKALIKIHIEVISDTVVIDYYDNGPGIKPELYNAVFTPFMKDQYSDGLGLGMTIISRSIDVLKGEIKCLPASSGVHFKIKFPYQP